MTTSYSAIVPNYNDGSKIAESLQSLLAQKLPFHEIIIVDDASTDNSVDIIMPLIAGLPHVRLVRHRENGGVVAALNTGIHTATGEFIFLCSANDTYYPMMTKWCEEMRERYPQAGIISGNVAAYDQQKQKFTYSMKLPLPQVRSYYAPGNFVQQCRKAAVHFNGGANALRADLLREIGGLRAPLRWHSDWFVNLMLAFRAGVAYVPENFSMCRLEGKKSYSSNRFHWPNEREVIKSSLEAMAEFPAEAAMFRHAALLPKYDLRALSIISDKKFRWFITPLLWWRIIGFSMAYRLKYIIPRPVLMYLRSWFRL